jgi:hypothetical protein
VFNVLAGALYGIPFKSDWITYLVISLQVCILVSCFFLADAYRRLKYIQLSDEIIDKTPVILLFISFGAFGISDLLMMPTYIHATTLYNNVSVVLFQVLYVVSCITLTVILFDLLVKQHKNCLVAPTVLESEQSTSSDEENINYSNSTSSMVIRPSANRYSGNLLLEEDRDVE